MRSRVFGLAVASFAIVVASRAHAQTPPAPGTPPSKTPGAPSSPSPARAAPSAAPDAAPIPPGAAAPGTVDAPPTGASAPGTSAGADAAGSATGAETPATTPEAEATDATAAGANSTADTAAAAPPKPEPGDAAAAVVAPPPEEASRPVDVPDATDTVGGHFNLALTPMVAIPFGAFEDNVDVADAVGPGFALGADLGIGLSRSVFVGAWGQAAWLGDGGDCAGDCSGKSYAFGPFVRYHLVQGVRFDPWLSAGVGYRTTNLDPAGVSYGGFELLRLQVGGDWYATTNFGIGAVLELDLGVYTTRSEGSIGDAAAHWQFASGLRVVFDVPGK